MSWQGTDAVKAIKLELPNLTRLDVDPRAFRKMKNLRLLMVRNARFSTNLKYLPDNLKWIKWHAFSQDSLPSSFITKNLVGLDLQYSRIQNVGKGWKVIIFLPVDFFFFLIYGSLKKMFI